MGKFLEGWSCDDTFFKKLCIYNQNGTEPALVYQEFPCNLYFNDELVEEYKRAYIESNLKDMSSYGPFQFSTDN